MQAVLNFAIKGDTGTADLCKSISFHGVDPHPFFNFLSHLIGPGLCTENTHTERQRFDVYFHLFRPFCNGKCIRRGAA